LEGRTEPGRAPSIRRRRRSARRRGRSLPVPIVSASSAVLGPRATCPPAARSGGDSRRPPAVPAGLCPFDIRSLCFSSKLDLLTRVRRWRDMGKLDCTIARTRWVIGDRWTLLILRDAFLGARRFEAFGDVTNTMRGYVQLVPGQNYAQDWKGSVIGDV